jgi:hypothetical protein
MSGGFVSRFSAHREMGELAARLPAFSASGWAEHSGVIRYR